MQVSRNILPKICVICVIGARQCKPLTFGCDLKLQTNNAGYEEVVMTESHKTTLEFRSFQLLHSNLSNDINENALGKSSKHDERFTGIITYHHSLSY